MSKTLSKVKQFAYHQMDAMWHNQSEFKTTGMVSFNYKGYTVVNPWMDEQTNRPVNPYKYYGKKHTKKFIIQAIRHIKKTEQTAQDYHNRHR